MANRSDFFSAAIPRQIKKMLILSGATRSERKAWAEAHAIHKRFKQKVNSSPAGRADKDDAE